MQLTNIKDQIRNLVKAAMLGDEQTKKKATEQISAIMQAALDGDQEAAQYAQLIKEVIQEEQGGQQSAFKDGGKVNSTKKNGTCPCMLKKVGGKLIEIDSCTGVPIAKNGMQFMAGGGTFMDALKSWKALGYFDDPNVGDLTSASARKRWAAKNGFGNYDFTKWQDNVKLWKMLENYFANASAVLQPEVTAIKAPVQGVQVAAPAAVSVPTVVRGVDKNGKRFRIENADTWKGSKSGLAQLDGENLYAGNALSGNREITSVGNKDEKFSSAELWNWVKTNIDNPYELFNPNYFNTRRRLSKKMWDWVLQQHPEYGRSYEIFKDNDRFWAKKEKEYNKNRLKNENAILNDASLSDEEKLAAIQQARGGEDPRGPRGAFLDLMSLVNDPNRMRTEEGRQYIQNLSIAGQRKLLDMHPEYYKLVSEAGLAAWLKGSIRKATDRCAQEMIPVVMGFLNPVAGMSADLLGKATDFAVQLRYDGRYANWGDMMSRKWDLDPYDNSTSAILKRMGAYVSNPGYIAGTVFGGLATPTFDSMPVSLQASNEILKGTSRGLESMVIPELNTYKTVTTSEIMPAQSGGGHGWGMGSGSFNGGGQAVRGVAYNGSVPIGGVYGSFNVPTVASPYFTAYSPLHINEVLQQNVDPLQPFTPVDIPSMYNSLYAWHKDPDWIKWWQQFFPKKEYLGTTLYFPGSPRTKAGWYKIIGGGQPIYLGNYDAALAPGVHSRGTGELTTEVVNPELEAIPYTGQPFYGTQVGASTVGTVADPIYGETMTLKNGGALRYSNYLK